MPEYQAVVGVNSEGPIYATKNFKQKQSQRNPRSKGQPRGLDAWLSMNNVELAVDPHKLVIRKKGK
tara:strand:+ start:408 stop:605 length:198 start_codon:yes stop_codon:yes gene_type:complete